MSRSKLRKPVFIVCLLIAVWLLLIGHWVAQKKDSGYSYRYAVPWAMSTSNSDVMELEPDPDEMPGSWDELVDQAVREGTSTFGTMMVEEGGVGPFPDPDVTPLCGPDGIITYYLMAEIGISKQEAVVVQAEIDRVNAAMSALARKHTVEAACDPTDTPDTTCYTISPYADQSGSVIARFSERLTDVIGQERAEKVVQSFEASARFAGFGSSKFMRG